MIAEDHGWQGFQEVYIIFIGTFFRFGGTNFRLVGHFSGVIHNDLWQESFRPGHGSIDQNSRLHPPDYWDIFPVIEPEPAIIHHPSQTAVASTDFC
jgi:hypothetical protein